MALQTLASPMIYPGNALYSNGTIVVTGIDAVDSGHYAAAFVNAHKDMTISHIWFTPQAVAGSPTCECRIESVSAGAVNGLWAANTTGTTGTLVAGTPVLQALTASATITKGQDFAVVYKYASGTTFTTGNLATTTGVTNRMPYRATNKTGSVVKADLTSFQFAIGTSATTFIPIQGMLPAVSVGGGTFNNTSSAARALSFTVPFNCRAIGMRFYAGTAAGDFVYGIYTGDASGTEVGSSATTHVGTALAGGASVLNVYFDTAVALTVGTRYRAAVTPNSATNSNVTTIVVPTADYLTACPGGAACYYSSLASGTWTDDQTQVPFMDILIDQLDDGVQVASSGARIIGG